MSNLLQKPTKSMHELSLLSSLSRAIRHCVGRNCGYIIMYLTSHLSDMVILPNQDIFNCEDLSLITGKSFQDASHLSFMHADVLFH